MTIPLWLIILAWVGIGMSIAQVAYWSAVLVQLARTFSHVPTARQAAARLRPDPSQTESVCIIVPAHNEASCIALIARSLLAQSYPRLSIVFSLDRCTDATEPILRDTVGADPRVVILTIDHCPDDWAGKSHALWTAATTVPAAADADLLVFVDADTQLDPNLITTCVALLRERELSLLSLLSTLTHDRWFERLIQPAATFELARQFPIMRANSPAPPPSPPAVARRPFANGQFILADRRSYFAFGGHQSIRTCVLEDVELARQAARHGLPTGLFLASGMLTCRMYDRYTDFVAGWTRIYRESANNRPARLRLFAWRVRLLGVVLPGAAFASLLLGAWLLARNSTDPGAVQAQATIASTSLAWTALATGAAASVAFASVLVIGYGLGRSGIHRAIAYPIGAWLVSAILMRAARELDDGIPIRWGGKSYQRPAR